MGVWFRSMRSFLGANALNACGDFVNADSEILGLIIWTTVNLLLLHFICLYDTMSCVLIFDGS